MACYIVIFELHDQSQKPTFIEGLKSFTGYCPLTPHSWAITTNKTAKEVRDQLAACMGPTDQLFVFRSGTEGAWRNSYGIKNNDWLKKNL